MNANESGKLGVPAIWDTPLRCERLVSDLNTIAVEHVFSIALVLPTLARLSRLGFDFPPFEAGAALTADEEQAMAATTSVWIEEFRGVADRLGYRELGNLAADIGATDAADVLASFGGNAPLSSRAAPGDVFVDLRDPVPDAVLREFFAAGGDALGAWARSFQKVTLELRGAAERGERFPAGLEGYAERLNNDAAAISVKRGRPFRELRRVYVVRGRTRRTVWAWSAETLLERAAIEAVELTTVRPPLAICETCRRPFVQRRGKRHCTGHLWLWPAGDPLANCALEPARRGTRARTNHETAVDTAYRRVKRLRAELESLGDPAQRHHIESLLAMREGEHASLKAKRGPKPGAPPVRPGPQ